MSSSSKLRTRVAAMSQELEQRDSKRIDAGIRTDISLQCMYVLVANEVSQAVLANSSQLEIVI
jgi:hypothetical protein